MICIVEPIQIYQDDIDLGGDDGGEESSLLAGEPSSLLLPQDSNQSRGDHDNTEESIDSSSTTRLSAEELALHTSVKRIHELQDEIVKIDADRQHWRALAKQVSCCHTHTCYTHPHSFTYYIRSYLYTIYSKFGTHTKTHTHIHLKLHNVSYCQES